eukprot:CAMPEP_0201740426 /NCGR_PEP_ID=MMETSP0593-20130828/46295_1 /ASSEMBLY_ACC=CAM_ASM_000672 /TAXON_ID=267983 /ORGANISM="Skeletonema japonicum, Strain CCMP2506" /LENGTH=650 /DNA_ID=CAMNT_0048234737 /DNA_START=1629 /DNA_END=3581 /DNA_ORIENTATION=-
MDILHIGLYIQHMKVSGSEAKHLGTLSELLREIGYGVLKRASLIGSCVAEDVDESEGKRATGKAKQQSLERLGPLFKVMNQSNGDVSSPMQSDKVKQLVAKHKEELMKMEKKIEDLKTAHKAELERVRAEAEQERMLGIKALSDQLKESHAVAEAAVARASTEQVLPRRRKTKRSAAMDNREENVTVDTNSFVTLLDVIEKSENKLIAGINLPILRLIHDIFDSAFENHTDLHQNLHHLAVHFISIFRLLPMLNEAFAAFVRAEAAREATELEMDSAVKMSSGFGTILSYCENDKFEMENDEEKSKEIPDIVYDIKRSLFCAIHGVGNHDNEIKRVVYHSRHNDVGTTATGVSRDVINNEVTVEDLRSVINGEVSNTFVKKHISIGNQTRCLMMHVLNCFLVVDLLSKISILATFQYLPNASDLHACAEEFAQRANPEVTFDETETALDFMLTYVSPALENDDLMVMEDAWTIACYVFVSLNQIVSVGNNASDDAKKNDPRKKHITSILRDVECRTITGHTDETTAVFWSGTGKVYSERRLRAYRTFAVFFLRTPIQRSLPPDFFAKFGFTHSFLRLPASSVRNLTTFITPNFCSEPEKYRGKFDSIVKKKAQKGEDMGERTLFIQGNEQRDSLKFLLDARRALDFKGEK